MAFQKRFSKQPVDRIDCPVDFVKFLAAHVGDSIDSFEFDCDSGLDVVSATLVGTAVVVVVEGGDSGRAYRVVVDATTANGLVKRLEIQIRVRGQNVTTADVDGGDIGVDLPEDDTETILDGGTP